MHNIIRVLSKLGVCSRKQAAELVQSGRVSLNGKIVRDPGAPARESDSILVDGKPPARTEKLYIILNKPADCVTTRSDDLGRKTVYDYLGDAGQWVFPVGRLDLESEGLLLFTNDAELGNRLTDPKYQTPRTYNVTLDKPLRPEDTERIRLGGIDIGRGEITAPAQIEISETDRKTVRITIVEGKNRELRRLFKKMHREVRRLVRTDFGGFRLDDLPPGQWRKCRPPAGHARKERR